MRHSKGLFMKQLQLAEVSINSFSSLSAGGEASEERIQSTCQIKIVTGLQMQLVF